MRFRHVGISRKTSTILIQQAGRLLCGDWVLHRYGPRSWTIEGTEFDRIRIRSGGFQRQRRLNGLARLRSWLGGLVRRKVDR